MDVYKIIRQLYEERARLTRIIATLEAVDRGVAPRRGRKSMSAAERKAVSERMKKYWAKKRKARQ